LKSVSERPIEETTGYLLARACKVHRGSVGGVLGEVGLHVGQEMVLSQLWRRDGLTPSELAGALGVEPPTVTNMLSRMQRAGLLERRRDPEDARCTRVVLTQKGRELRGPVERRWETVEERALAGITAEEETLLRELLARIRSNLTRGPAAAE
jgi:DNA-binding MarR family transcriptional regulator